MAGKREGRAVEGKKRAEKGYLVSRGGREMEIAFEALSPDDLLDRLFLARTHCMKPCGPKGRAEKKDAMNVYLTQQSYAAPKTTFPTQTFSHHPLSRGEVRVEKGRAPRWIKMSEKRGGKAL